MSKLEGRETAKLAKEVEEYASLPDSEWTAEKLQSALLLLKEIIVAMNKGIESGQAGIDRLTRIMPHICKTCRWFHDTDVKCIHIDSDKVRYYVENEYIHPSQDTRKRNLPFSLDGRIDLYNKRHGAIESN